MSLNLLIIGKTGQLARALAQQTQHPKYKSTYLDRAMCDLSNAPEKIYDTLRMHSKPDALIISAAYTGVDHAEKDQDTAFAVNGQACGSIAKFCRTIDIPLIHVSTDYVFDGTNNTPYRPDQEPAPLGVYGKSKLDGEMRILASGCRGTILRTSWVYDGIGKNFLTTMLRLARTNDQLKIVNDQIGRPTYAAHLAKSVLAAAQASIDKKPLSSGIFHVSGSGEPISWADFAGEIFEQSNEISKSIDILGIPSDDYPTAAERPHYSVLDNSTFENTFEYKLPHWKQGLREALGEREKAVGQ